MVTRYKNAPIAEAVIDIRAEVSEDVSIESFAALIGKLNEKFPHVMPIHAFEMGFAQEVGRSASVHTSHAVLGQRLQSSDGSRVLQLRLDGFTYSWIAPYESWFDFRSEAKYLWSMFSEHISHRTVARAAVRVINKIELHDDPPVQLTKYFNIYPNIPDGMSGQADTFFLQLQTKMDHCSPGARAIINFAGSEVVQDNPAELVLDFDVYVDREFESKSEDLWHCLDGLSACKNALFEACINDKLRELIS